MPIRAVMPETMQENIIIIKIHIIIIMMILVEIVQILFLSVWRQADTSRIRKVLIF